MAHGLKVRKTWRIRHGLRGIADFGGASNWVMVVNGYPEVMEWR
jgi:hypothetical protein